MDIYESDFRVFLSHTDEKEVIYQKICKIIEENKINSILDIGAGNGDLSIPLSKKVNKYLTVEFRDKYVELLKSAGLRVIAGKFPIRIDDKFDLVLCSHSIPYDKKEYENLLKSAYNHITDEGLLIVITYGKEKDDWNKLLSDVGVPPFKDHYKRFDDLELFLSKLGNVKKEILITHVTTDTFDNMFAALSFVAGGGIQEIKDKFIDKKMEIINILAEKYLKANQIKIPFNHVVYTITSRQNT
jgi:SAM-dependent methyltransferase